MAQIFNLPILSSAFAYYRLEDESDSKGASTLTNNNSVTFTGAKYENGANLGSSNTNKSLTVNGNLGITGSACTICGWVKLLSEISSGSWGFLDQSDTGSEVEYILGYEYNGGTQRIRFDRTKRLVSNNAIYHNLTLGTSNFYHLALTYDTTNLIAYVNGAAVGSPLATSGNGIDTGSSLDKFIIGGIQNNFGATESFASVLIDDVAVFQSALTAQQIYSIYVETSGILNFEI